MAKINISVSENNTEEQLSVIEIEGIIDTLTVAELEKVLESLIGIRQFNIIINLSAVEYISSAGWSTLISRASLFQEKGGYLCLSGLIPNVRENFEEFEFNKIIDAFENPGLAREAVAEKRAAIQTTG